MNAAPWVKALALVLGARLVQTHISWVLLGPEYAWKIKRPVSLPFVDYASLDARRHFCEEEVRLNARLARGLYLGVDVVRGTPADPHLGQDGPVLDYAVRMRRFADGSTFAQRLATDSLPDASIEALAGLLGRFHADAPRRPAARDWGSPARRQDAALGALAGLASHLRQADRERLRTWLGAESRQLEPLWALRQRSGHVRECHGDLHLDNLVVLPAGVAAFDGIEFDPALRWIDVIDDIAFPVMDFDAHARPDLGWTLLSAWLDATGEHGGVPALRFAVVYRALVRAHVALLRQPADGGRADLYLQTALRWCAMRRPRLTITHGLPGSGKSFASAALIGREGAIRLRADVERKRLHGLSALDDSRACGFDIYTPEATRRTYTHLFDIAEVLLRAGHHVILDAAFLRRAERTAARALAVRCDADFRLLHCEAPADLLRQRLAARHADPSEADAAVLARLMQGAEPLGPDEPAAGVPVPAPTRAPGSGLQ